jgi:hypothetical protein
MPKTYYDPAVIEKLALIQRTPEEIAERLGTTPKLILRRFGRLYRMASARGRDLLAATQYHVAQNKQHPGMLMWLGKQHMGQTSNPKQVIDQKIVVRRQIDRPQPRAPLDPTSVEGEGEAPSGRPPRLLACRVTTTYVPPPPSAAMPPSAPDGIDPPPSSTSSDDKSEDPDPERESS